MNGMTPQLPSQNRRLIKVSGSSRFSWLHLCLSHVGLHLIKLSQFNENIEVNFLLKKDNEELLRKLSGEMKLPTIMVMDSDNNVIRKFVEFPKGVKDILINSPKEETQKVIDEMRNGKYNDLIQLDLIKFITGKKYEYISFERLDK